MKQVRMTVVISGRVQGVFYRQSTKQMAETLGLTGWVKNLPNGDVEALFEGEESNIRQMLNWCYRGPKAARVDKVHSAESPASGEFPRFSIKR
ncbi:MAG: acylphosphatase [Desulfuromonas sp.]|nr:MAG: acylphosphatase [Desulfuromonas sp.]